MFLSFCAGVIEQGMVDNSCVRYGEFSHSAVSLRKLYLDAPG